MADVNDRLEAIKAEAAEILANEEISAQDRVERLEALKAERETLEAEVKAAALADELTAEAPTDDTPVAEAEDADAEDAEADATDEPVAEDEAEEEAAEEATADLKEPIAAASVKDAPGANALADDDFRPALVASANADGMRVGNEVTLENFDRVHQSARRVDDAVQRFGNIRVLTPGVSEVRGNLSAEQNTAILASASDSEYRAITAAACFCGPDEAVKDIASCSTSERPVQSLFRTVGVTGRFNYLKSLGIADVDGGIKIWECSDQDAVDPADPGSWKPCVDLDCQADVTVEPYAVTQCGTISVHTQLSNENLVDNFIEQLGVAWARRAEQKLLDRIVEQSDTFTVDAAALGTQSLLNTLEFVGSQLVSLTAIPNRQPTDGYVALVPVGTLTALIADQHLRGGGQEAASRDEIIAQIEDSLNARVVLIWDVDTAGEGAYNGAAANLPGEGASAAWVQGSNNVGTHPIYILNPAAFRAGSSVAVDAGFIRDAELTRRNQVQYFFENLEFLEKVACHKSYVLRLTGCPSGVVSAPDTAPNCIAP